MSERARGALCLRLLSCVSFCYDAGTSAVLCVTVEETLAAFRSSIISTKCLTRGEFMCLMMRPRVACMLMSWTLVVEDRICK